MQDPDQTQAINDPLTGAYSRALFGPRLAEELSRASRSSVGCALFLFDLDYFKSINDAYGHQRGDDVLCQLTERINSFIRGYDTLFRYGGDEFVLLLPETAKADAIRVALRLVNGIKATPFPGDPPLSVSVSLGVAAFPDDATDAEGLIAAADRRNYLAKHRGRACAVADDVENDARPNSSRLLERDMPLAAAREFLTRVMSDESGALQVSGEPGSGYSRFMEEVVRTSRLRGLAVIEATDPDEVTVTGLDRPTLVVLDADLDPRVPGMVRRLRAAGNAALGLVYRARAASGLTAATPGEVGLPVLDTVELLAWSPAAIRVWLRTTLQGEPSPVLVTWLADRAAGLPARIAREIDRLTERDGLLRTETGWTIAPAVLNRGSRTRRPLPAPMTELIGRQQETAQVARLIAGCRLVTLVGPGGIGKTRLSLAVAAAVADTFDDGVAFVALDPARTESDVLALIAGAVDVAEVPGQAMVETLIDQLADRAMLLVLDNFEQATAAADVLGALLAAAPGLKVLVSSRERLGLYGEQAYAVPPLALPDLDGLQATAAGVATALAGSPALALFNARAHAAAFDFAVGTDNLVAVSTLCHRLDGLPLAIELAAAHSDELSPAEMLTQLSDRLDLEGPAPRGVPQRQRTLRAAIDWSFTLLESQEQDLFVRLGVFAGGSRLDAIEAVSPDEDVAKRLDRLVHKSLVRAEPEAGDATRYMLLETIRAYTAERLADSDHHDAVRDAHAAHYAHFADTAGEELTGPGQTEWVARIEREYRNLRRAFGHSLAGGDPATAVRVAVGLWRFWRNAGWLREGRGWLDLLLDPAMVLADAARARVLHAAAVLAAAQDDHASARALAEESLALARAAGDARTGAKAENALGIAAMTAGEYAVARDYFTDSLAVWRDLDEPYGMAMAHGNLTMVALRLGEFDAAGEHAVRCLEMERARGNTRGIMLGLLCLGEIEVGRGADTAARAHLDEALALGRGVGDVFGEAMALHQLGMLSLTAGRHAEAVGLIADALALRHNADDREDLAVSLDTLARTLAHGEPPARLRPELAARLLGAAEALRTQHRLPTPAGEQETTLEHLRTGLAPDVLDLHLTTGRTASIDTIVDEALALLRA